MPHTQIGRGVHFAMRNSATALKPIVASPYVAQVRRFLSAAISARWQSRGPRHSDNIIASGSPQISRNRDGRHSRRRPQGTSTRRERVFIPEMNGWLAQWRFGITSRGGSCAVRRSKGHARLSGWASCLAERRTSLIRGLMVVEACCPVPAGRSSLRLPLDEVSRPAAVCHTIFPELTPGSAMLPREAETQLHLGRLLDPIDLYVRALRRPLNTRHSWRIFLRVGS